ncbi:MAG: hypothetical protein RLZZ601_2059 [Pseudomonadota bacterium]
MQAQNSFFSICPSPKSYKLTMHKIVYFAFKYFSNKTGLTYNIPADKALEHVYGYGVGLDMTRRDLQGEAKKMGRPWDTGKAFDQSAPCAAITPAAQFGHPNKGVVKLLVNGEVRQEGNLNQLIWNIPDTIAYLSTLFTLEPGDLIMSGTPAGVGPVKKGDVLEGSVEGLTPLKIKIV